METKHSKTPWNVVIIPPTSKLRQDTGATMVRTNSGTMAIDCMRSGFTFDESAANAAHIVRCVNSHDALVAALELARDYINDESIAHAVTNHPKRPTRTLLMELNDALKLARGE